MSLKELFIELENSKYDLARSQESLAKGDFKWASIKAY